MEIGKRYKPELPTPKMMVEHLSAHHCMQILDPDYPSPILPPDREVEGATVSHRAVGEEEGPCDVNEKKKCQSLQRMELPVGVSGALGKNDLPRAGPGHTFLGSLPNLKPS